MLSKSAHLVLGAVALSSLAAAQGADQCSNAQPISGTGLFPFSNASANSDGGNHAACSKFGQQAINHDVWFAWTAPATDMFTVETCGHTGVDTKLAVYAGTSCPTGAPLDCNDDSCSLQSRISFNATSGNVYLLRVGTYPGAAGGTGDFEVIQGGSTGGCTNQAIGPDVIVGDVAGCQTWGTAGNMSGYSLGTTSCNIGDTELQWISGNNQHPVIGQNIYRLENGRFEQVGQSWLKHGFTALQQNLCCNCISSGTGSRLGVGCSDPYGAGLNGNQAGLGPRFQVNAFTGAFSYPYAGQGSTGDYAFKRIQVLKDDVSPTLHPNATYLGEAQYVTPDDAAAGNHFNNVSYRRLSRSSSQTNGAYRLDTTGPTEREKPAIQGWQDLDPTVNLQPVQIPNEGLLYVASNCYDEGGGQWRYEFAVFNLNSDRSVRSFSVPIGSNVNVTGVGSSFPLYHSGEPYTNLSWNGQVHSDRVEWSTQNTHAQNANANAIRWGTMYTFWFLADTAPEDKTASLGLFKPGPAVTPMATACGPMDGSGGGPIVTNYCTANVNSTGFTTKITGQNYDGPGRTMEILAWDMPQNAFGFFIVSDGQVFVANPSGSQGNLCVGPDIGRGVAGGIQSSGVGGTFGGLADLDNIPTPNAPAVVMPGDTWYFQAWHRDAILGTPVSNFSDGVSIQFP